MSLYDEDLTDYIKRRTGIKDVPLGKFNPMYQLTEFEFFAILDMLREMRTHLKHDGRPAVEKRLDIITELLERKKEVNPDIVVADTSYPTKS